MWETMHGIRMANGENHISKNHCQNDVYYVEYDGTAQHITYLPVRIGLSPVCV